MRTAATAAVTCTLVALLLARGVGRRLAGAIVSAYKSAGTAIIEARYLVGLTLRNHSRRRVPDARRASTRSRGRAGRR
jgi:hypothetical protein